MVLEAPDLERNKVVRWRCADLQAEIAPRWSVSVAERTVGKLLRRLRRAAHNTNESHRKFCATSCAVALLQSGTDVTVIRDYLGHASVTTTGRYIATNLQMKRDAMEIFWDRAGIEPTSSKIWKPKPGQSLEFI